MAKINGLEKMTYKELVDLQKRVDKAIVERKSADKAELKRKIAEVAAASGFDLAELIGKGASRKGAKVGVKFRNPADPTQTWAGRGRQPRWLSTALKKGQKLEDFAV